MSHSVIVWIWWRDFVAEQYDGELDGCIKRAESLLKAVPNPSPRSDRWLVPR